MLIGDEKYGVSVAGILVELGEKTLVDFANLQLEVVVTAAN